MKTRFGKYAVMLIVTFVAGGLYGALWEHYLINNVKSTGPVTLDDLAQARAGLPKPGRPPASIQAGTNAHPVLRQ